MSENRDRAELILDEDVQTVLEFMQRKIVTSRIVAVAENLPQMARLLWGHYPQESLVVCNLLPELPKASTSHGKQSSATESVPVPACADDDSGVEECGPRQ